MRLTNKLGLPEAIANAVANDDYSRGESDISVTQLIAPPQQVALMRTHWDDIEEDVSDRLYALMGQAMHTILERAHDSALKENRLYLKVQGWTISGQYDRFHVQSGVMQDYKLASVWEYIYGLKAEREQQLNLLAYLAQRNGYEIKKLEVVMMFRDWSKSKAKFDAAYPQQPMAILPVDLWPEEQAAAYLAERIGLHQQAKSGAIASCTDAERWAKPAVYAVMKEGRKSAVKLHDDATFAARHAADIGGHVVHRPGEQTRCENYCNASAFCSQFKAIQGETV